MDTLGLASMDTLGLAIMDTLGLASIDTLGSASIAPLTKLIMVQEVPISVPASKVQNILATGSSEYCMCVCGGGGRQTEREGGKERGEEGKREEKRGKREREEREGKKKSVRLKIKIQCSTGILPTNTFHQQVICKQTRASGVNNYTTINFLFNMNEMHCFDWQEHRTFLTSLLNECSKGGKSSAWSNHDYRNIPFPW